ncbi:LicD family protein [Lactococcus taiwanensis]
MKEISLEEMRQLQLEMLEYIDKVCRDNGIEYSLAGGSLLGVVRHQGFIPWDDDVDLMMTRDNYEKFVKVALNRGESNYSLSYYKERPAYFPYIKMYDHRTLLKSKVSNLVRGTGIFTDIFPIDILPDDEMEFKKFHRKVFLDTRRLAASNTRRFDYASGPDWKNVIFASIAYLPWHIKYYGKYKEISEKMDKFMSQYNNTDNKYSGFASSRYRTRERFPREIYNEYEDVIFENITVRKIVDHDTYLSKLYGDYMVIPKESEQVNHDYYKYEWK